VRVHADDPDEGSSGHVTYGFPDYVERVYGDLFRVDSDSGAIYLRTALDYEKSTSYHLLVTATDLGTPPSLPVSAKVYTVNIMPCTRRRRRRDSTVELSRVYWAP